MMAKSIQFNEFMSNQGKTYDFVLTINYRRLIYKHLNILHSEKSLISFVNANQHSVFKYR